MDILAISGGQLVGETLPLDRFNVELTGKGSPKALFVPTASHDSPGYCQAFREVYGTRLGCQVSFLLLDDPSTTPSRVEDQIGEGDFTELVGRRSVLGYGCDDHTALWYPNEGPRIVRSARDGARVRVYTRQAGGLTVEEYRDGEEIPRAAPWP
jgi:hypothetical protein